MERITLKTEALISTILLVGIMTTNGRIFINNLSLQNELIVIRQSLCFLGAIGYLGHREFASEYRRESFDLIVNYLVDRYPDGAFWVFTGHSIYQPLSRITKYRKLWKQLKVRGFEVPTESKIEWMVENENGVKFFGAFHAIKPDYELINSLTNVERITRVVFFPKPINFRVIESELSDGWEALSSAVPISKLIDFCCRFESFLIQLIGEFDDKESGVIAIAKQGMFSN
jgi:hypothetical protein